MSKVLARHRSSMRAQRLRKGGCPRDFELASEAAHRSAMAMGKRPASDELQPSRRFSETASGESRIR
jgi:hypothetical protein